MTEHKEFFPQCPLREHMARECENACIVESPIEALMDFALYLEMHSYRDCYDQNFIFNYEPQAKVGKYRVDFLLSCDNGNYVIVECDGHEYHEKSKKQAARDKSRDRDLQSKGYIALRFTGSEIYKNPFQCAEKAFSVVDDILTGNLDRLKAKQSHG